jgi:hypothetical protein
MGRIVAYSVGNFDSVAAATEKIIEVESYPVSGIFFEVLIEIGPGAGSEHEAFGHLEHIGNNTCRCYLVKRVEPLEPLSQKGSFD